ncbi:MAG TPA: DUF2585 family protein [Candidatus Hydrogenedentes bacterium]|nr:DUF2585 family protein [Candidatus Hydrogenedentota bacterium]
MSQNPDDFTGRKNPFRAMLWLGLFLIPLLVLMIFQLHCQGRLWWCSCGHWWPWAGNVHSMHNSQHIADPYSLTHLLHGVVLCGALAGVAARISWKWRFSLALAAEMAWEIFENTGFVIQRYREATLALGYTGDTIVNSLGDVLCCGIGFLIARRLGFWRSVFFFFLVEVILILWIHDSLLLNLLMLIVPVDAIKTWQINQ